ncbi:MAG: PilZ domain-containing protein [Sphingomonas sp.]
MDHNIFSHATESAVTDDGRGAERKGVVMRAQLRDRNSAKYKVALLDLSTSGFRAESTHAFHQGETVWLTVPGFAGQQAVVKWATPFECGCAFVAPLYPSVFEHIAAIAARG